MHIKLQHFVEPQSGEVCGEPTMRKLIAAHVVELLEDSAAAEVEDHLLDCLHCREIYLKMHSVLGAEPDSVRARKAGDESSLKRAKVASIADFRRRRQ
jgi:predicted anti-sigma-YlaC factor YlaD